MAVELAETGKYNIVRTDDRQMLLDIRAHKYTYDEILSMCEGISERFEDVSKKSKLQKHVDHKFVKNLLVEYRKYIYKKNQ